VFGPSQISGKFELTFGIQIWRLPRGHNWKGISIYYATDVTLQQKSLF
jgi:hypothetical protein